MELAERASNKPTAIRYRRMARAWFALAAEQDWLDGHPTQGERANELAAGTIDTISDDGASDAVKNDRKRELLDGPAELRKARVDNH